MMPTRVPPGYSAKTRYPGYPGERRGTASRGSQSSLPFPGFAFPLPGSPGSWVRRMCCHRRRDAGGER
eukprot:694668-Rhodomonas_salina.2